MHLSHNNNRLLTPLITLQKSVPTLISENRFSTLWVFGITEPTFGTRVVRNRLPFPTPIRTCATLRSILGKHSYGLHSSSYYCCSCNKKKWKHRRLFLAAGRTEVCAIGAGKTRRRTSVPNYFRLKKRCRFSTPSVFSIIPGFQRYVSVYQYPFP